LKENRRYLGFIIILLLTFIIFFVISLLTTGSMQKTGNDQLHSHISEPAPAVLDFEDEIKHPCYDKSEWMPLRSNYRYSYGLTYSIQDYGLDSIHQLQTKEGFSTRIVINDQSVVADIYPFEGDKMLIEDIELFFAGPTSEINHDYLTFSRDDRPEGFQASSICNCFIQVGQDIYLGYDSDGTYHIKHLIYSTEKDIRLGDLVPTKEVYSPKDTRPLYRCDVWWSSSYFTQARLDDYWHDAIGRVLKTPSRLMYVEAINDLPQNQDIVKPVQIIDQYDGIHRFRGVSQGENSAVSNWAVIFGKDTGIFVITAEVRNEIFWGSAYILVDHGHAE